ncbi:MAG TPA: hypothetical protein VJT75_01760 [Thermoleophilaceae bacterium]|nr:hypothetical protein [Thermoleophilaceae bacterium]
MDSTQTPFGTSLPALDPFGGPHFTAEDELPADPPAWTGDPSSVPLPSVADGAPAVDGSKGEELDGAIFAAMLTP